MKDKVKKPTKADREKFLKWQREVAKNGNRQ